MDRSLASRDAVRRGHLLLVVVAIVVMVAAACSGDDATDPIVPWTQDPCGLAPPQDVADAFGLDPVAVRNAPLRECRYTVGDTLLRIAVLADTNVCAGVERSAAARGESLERPEAATDGIFVVEPTGDVVVCESTSTFVLSAEGRTAPLLTLADLGLARRAR